MALTYVSVLEVSTSISSLNSEATQPPEEAFDAMLMPLFPSAYRLAFGMLRDRQEAEDAVQEAALHAWTRRTTFRAGADVRPWFFAIVANQCRDLRRGRWSRLIRQANPEVESFGVREDPDEDMDLRRALNRLGHDDRLVLVLRYYLDLEFVEIAATLRISEDAARSRTHRAVRRLRPVAFEQELTP
jgi:RNA polymerase sigma-70 factor (ECF subfamily)